jgi:hypothetical protein
MCRDIPTRLSLFIPCNLSMNFRHYFVSSSFCPFDPSSLFGFVFRKSRLWVQLKFRSIGVQQEAHLSRERTECLLLALVLRTRGVEDLLTSPVLVSDVHFLKWQYLSKPVLGKVQFWEDKTRRTPYTKYHPTLGSQCFVGVCRFHLA